MFFAALKLDFNTAPTLVQPEYLYANFIIFSNLLFIFTTARPENKQNQEKESVSKSKEITQTPSGYFYHL